MAKIGDTKALKATNDMRLNIIKMPRAMSRSEAQSEGYKRTTTYQHIEA